MTAYQLLHRVARVQRGQRVLVHGAAGAAGQALLVLGSMAGLRLWGGAHGRHAKLIREFGATPIDYQGGDFTRVLPDEFDAVFDDIGEDGYRRSFAAQAPAVCSAPMATRRAYRASDRLIINVPADPPVSLYWSPTVYDRANHALTSQGLRP